MRRIAIFGAGPSGLAAAWAVIQTGNEPVIIDRVPAGVAIAPSAGVFYLHDSLDLPLSWATVQIAGLGGDAVAYAAKVYGDESIQTSFPRRKQHETAYNAEQAFNYIRDIIRSANFRYIQAQIAGLEELRSYAEGFDGAVSTLPLDALGVEGCRYRRAWVVVSEAPRDEAYMLYNAHPAIPWYRAAAVFGRFTMEYLSPPDNDSAIPLKKVVARDAPLPDLGENVLFAGRFGCWDKRILAHDVYRDVLRWLTAEKRVAVR